MSAAVLAAQSAAFWAQEVNDADAMTESLFAQLIAEVAA